MSYNHENWQVDAEKYFKKLIGGGILIFQFLTFYGPDLIFLPKFLKNQQNPKNSLTSQRWNLSNKINMFF